MSRIVAAVLVLAACLAVGEAADRPDKPLYFNDFEKLEVGAQPEGLLILGGDFAVRAEAGNQFLELPGAPIDANEPYGLLIGQERDATGWVGARIRSHATGKRYPEFGVGLGGLPGYRLILMPATGRLRLLKEETELLTTAPFKWKPGSWTRLELRVRPVGNKWLVEGRAWEDGQAEPSAWQIRYEDTSLPPKGRPTLWGTPYSEKPIAYDDVFVAP